MGKRHAAHARALGWDVKAFDALQARSDFSVYTQAHDWAPNAVVVASPVDQHARAIQEWSKLPLFVEKPLSVASYDVTLKPHRGSMVGFNWRYHPDVLGWRETWPSTPSKLLLDCNTNISDWPGSDYGDPLLECSHELDLLRWLRAPVEPKLTKASKQDGYEGVSLEFDGGDRIELRWNVKPDPSRRLIARWSDRPESVIWPSLGDALEQSYRTELADFLHCVETGGTPKGGTFDDGVAVLALCEQVAAKLKK